ncbi:DUF2934 domain-containing protein [Agrobacterium rhizogenes]|nr:DUF2934 domain-containing protein [Rhizobium rhizogenes]NTH62207.1 DUF2934 domain-containing protein [Rhizobium rhizogenes]NTH93833.1 DUF2934 domain-containing protein [Rhizobium rhizogenes]
MESSREDKVRLRAYQIWEDEGRPEGEAIAHWYRADSEIEPEEHAGQRPIGSKPSEGEETESATHAIEAPQMPPNGRRRRTPLSGVADSWKEPDSNP